MNSHPAIRFLLILIIGFALLQVGCSRLEGPVAPAGDVPLPLDDRDGPSFASVLQASLHSNYVEVGDDIVGSAGGTVSGGVTGYDNSFVIDVPAGAFTGTLDIRVLVPLEAVPVYQLLPHGSFSKDLEVTLDYSFWLDEGDIVDGDDYELVYMNEITGQFESLSPAATFTADDADPTVTFKTNHFSKWHVQKD